MGGLAKAIILFALGVLGVVIVGLVCSHLLSRDYAVVVSFLGGQVIGTLTVVGWIAWTP